MGGPARLLLLAALGVGVCLVGIELMITAVALPRILQDLADWTQLREASWIVNGYLVAYIAAMPLAGRAGDRFGIPPLFLAALVLFAAGSLAAGASQDLPTLIAARVVQGMGAGAVVPLATAGASHLYEGHARARALGLIGALTFLGMAAGPFLGATILDVVDLSTALAARGLQRTPMEALTTPSWRWVFYLGAPAALLSGVYVWAAAPGWRLHARAARIDVPGAVFFTAATACGLIALTWTGSESADASAPVVPLAILAVVAAAFAVIRFRHAPEPFIELRFFRDRSFSAAVLLSLLTGYALATAIIGGAVFVDRVRYGGPDEQRLALGGLAGATAIGALASGIALRWLGPALLSVVGLAAGVLGLALLALARPDTPMTNLILGLVVFGLGFGLTVTPRSTAAVEALGRRAYGLASSAVTVARMLGMAIGLAILTVLGSNRIESLSVVLTDAAARDAVLPPALRGRPLQDALVVEALERWAAGEASTILAGLFAVAGAVMAVAVLPALAMRRRDVEERGTLAGERPQTERRSDDAEPALTL